MLQPQHSQLALTWPKEILESPDWERSLARPTRKHRDDDLSHKIPNASNPPAMSAFLIMGKVTKAKVVVRLALKSLFAS